MPQAHAEIDLAFADSHISRSIMANWHGSLTNHSSPTTSSYWKGSRGRPGWPRGRGQLSVSEQRLVSQMRADRCPLFRSFLHTLGRSPYPNCAHCGREETVRHVISSCPSHAAARRQAFGVRQASYAWPNILFENPEGIIKFLKLLGRLPEAPPGRATAAAAASSSP